MRTTKRIGALLIAAALTVLATGCGTQEEPVVKTPTPPASTPTKPSAPPTPTTSEPTTDMVTLPACDQIDLTEVQDSPVAFIIEEVDIANVGTESFGPAAITAREGALQQRGCLIYLPDTEFGVHFLLAELSSDAKTTFVNELESSLFVKSEIRPGVSAYTYLNQHEAETPWYQLVTHAFVGDVWIAEDSGGVGYLQHEQGPHPFTGLYADAVKALNPGL